MSDDSRIPWLALQRLPALGARSLHALLQHFGDAREILDGELQVLQAAGAPAAFCTALRQYRRQAPGGALMERVHRDLEWLECHGTQLVHWGEARYPQLLRQIYAPPPVLYLQGDLELLRAPQLALVGTRRPSAGGRSITQQLAAELAHSGLAVSSGMARGIDSIGHRAVLAAGGKTVAVLGSGIDCIYPPEHLELSREIAARGALISEFPLGTSPTRSSFPQRNRVISGLSLGVLVVEAALRSGSLITARYAREQNREVFAVPGSIHNPMSQGCNRLIRDGAKLTEKVEDILEELPEPFCSRASAATAPAVMMPASTASASTAPPATAPAAMMPAKPGNVSPAEDAANLDRHLRILLEAVGFEPTPAELAIARSRLAPGTVAAALNELELRGWVERTPMGYIRCR